MFQAVVVVFGSVRSPPVLHPRRTAATRSSPRRRHPHQRCSAFAAGPAGLDAACPGGFMSKDRRRADLVQTNPVRAHGTHTRIHNTVVFACNLALARSLGEEEPPSSPLSPLLDGPIATCQLTLSPSGVARYALPPKKKRDNAKRFFASESRLAVT